jgi:predicted TIM-barrel fold metal-dependent hydrolase
MSPPQLTSVRRIQRAVACFGADRIVLGSDVPYGRGNLAINIARVRALPIDAEEQDLILGENMRCLLDLPR